MKKKYILAASVTLLFVALLLLVINHIQGKKTVPEPVVQKVTETLDTLPSKKTEYKASLKDSDNYQTHLKQLNKDHLNSKVSYNDKIIYGLWFEPHGASHHFVFYKDGTFVHELDSTESGSYKLKGDSVILKYNNGKRLGLRHWNPWNGNTGKYLTKGKKGDWDLYMVKGDFNY